MNSRFAQPDPSLAAGARLEGFTVVASQPIPELDGSAYLMRHDATGARLAWIACDDDNRSFAISFKTPPADDTGVFHILEHSVLCGSERFPVKEPFVNLIKTSMNTFLNAMTFPDKTMYPVASTNVKDLENLMDVYLDAVLQPNIYTRPRIFEQEGWHLELDGEGDDERLTYNGVVFNEMKGALSDPEDMLIQRINARMYPDTAYGHESGGNPRAIPTLTYEQFLDNHARHYSLSNSYTMLYGDLDIRRELAFIGKRFDEAPNRNAGAPNELAFQKPVASEPIQVKMATAPENALVGLAFGAGDGTDRTHALAVEILFDALMGSNEAPLKRKLLDMDLGSDVIGFSMDGQLQLMALFELKGAKADVADTFERTVREECARLVREGIPHENLEASIASATFNLREGDWGYYPAGIALSVQAMNSWLYDDDRPFDFLHYEDALRQLGAMVDNGGFERLLDQIVCTSTHNARVELVPTQDGDATEEAAELQERLSAMNSDEREAVRAEVAALREQQEREDDPADLARLPRLGLDDIGEMREHPEPTFVDAQMPTYHHSLDTHKIDYIYHYFDMDCLDWDDLPYATILAKVLGKLGTAAHTASELDTYLERNLGSFYAFNEMLIGWDHETHVRPTFVVSASTLSENVEVAAEAIQEILTTTDLSDTDRIRAVLQQVRVGIEQALVGAGHSIAMGRASSYFSRSYLAAEKSSGIDYYLFIRDLLENYDERANGLAERLRAVAAKLFRAGNVELSFTGTREDLDRYLAVVGTLDLPEGKSEHALEVPDPVCRNEAFVVPSNVSYTGTFADGQELGLKFSGSWKVAGRALSFDYLWNEVRVKGGAYGCGFRCSPAMRMMFYTYRDPNIDDSLRRMDEAAAWLASWNPTDDDLCGYIVSTVSTIDAPVKPRALARRQDIGRKCERDPELRKRTRDEIIATTAEDVRALADGIKAMNHARGRCVFGSAELIASSKLDWNVVELLGKVD